MVTVTSSASPTSGTASLIPRLPCDSAINFSGMLRLTIRPFTLVVKTGIFLRSVLIALEQRKEGRASKVCLGEAYVVRPSIK